MPVYEYKCTRCAEREEHILLAGEDEPSTCTACGGALKRAYAGRVGISLSGWGFSKTDALIRDTRGKDFKKLRERAERIVDE